MNYVIYILLWVFIVGIGIFWAAINAPLVDDDNKIIEESKWQKWKRTLRKK